MRPSFRPNRLGRHLFRRLVAFLTAGLLAALVAAPAAAATPANDLPSGATVIGSLPHSIDQDTTACSVEEAEKAAARVRSALSN